MSSGMAIVVAMLIHAGPIAQPALAGTSVEPRPIVLVEDRQESTEVTEKDKEECRHARTMYQGMLATGTNSWKGTPRSSLLEDVKSCERTGRVAR